MLSKKLEKLNKIEEQIRKLTNQQKMVAQQYKEEERRERTSRLCKRGGYIEKIFPDILKLTDTQSKQFFDLIFDSSFATARFKEILGDDSNNSASDASSAPSDSSTSQTSATSKMTESLPTPQSSIYVEDD